MNYNISLTSSQNLTLTSHEQNKEFESELKDEVKCSEVVSISRNICNKFVQLTIFEHVGCYICAQMSIKLKNLKIISIQDIISSWMYNFVFIVLKKPETLFQRIWKYFGTDSR